LESGGEKERGREKVKLREKGREVEEGEIGKGWREGERKRES